VTDGIQFDDFNFDRTEYSDFKAYAQSKLANVYFASELDRRYGSRGLHALSVHPGSILTKLRRHLRPDNPLLAAMSGNEEYIKSQKSVEQGAATQVRAAVAREWEGKGGRYLENCAESPPLDPIAPFFTAGYAPHAYNPDAEARLWKASCEMVGIDDD